MAAQTHPSVFSAGRRRRTPPSLLQRPSMSVQTLDWPLRWHQSWEPAPQTFAFRLFLLRVSENCRFFFFVRLQSPLVWMTPGVGNGKWKAFYHQSLLVHLLNLSRLVQSKTIYKNNNFHNSCFFFILVIR